MVASLSADRLRRLCDSASLGFETTAEVSASDDIIGQPRARAALRLALGMTTSGYHIFIAGPAGTGKMTAVNAFLDEAARGRPSANDTCYVFNFVDPEHPRLLRLPPGVGRQLSRDLDQLLTVVRRQLPRAFEADDYVNRRDALLKELDEDQQAHFAALNDLARARGMALEMTPAGLALVPLVNGRPMQREEFDALGSADRASWQLKQAELDGEISRAMKELRQREAAAREKLTQLDRDVALHTVGGLIEDVAERYAGFPSVGDYLSAVLQDLVTQADAFRETPNTPGAADPLQALQRERTWRRYRVNVLVDGSATAGAPVVLETNPTYSNLLGRVEHEAQLGVMLTDFTLIRAGALHRANGGYLVLRAEDLLRQPLAWEGLKRALRNREIVVEDPTETLGISTVRTLHPEAVPLDVKVVLTGDPSLFQLLHGLDPDFPELFRVHSDFSEHIPRTLENENALARFVSRLCRDDGLLAFSSDGVAAVIEYAARLAEDAEKLSVRFGTLANLVREASYWAKQAEFKTVSREHVRKALAEQAYRSGLIEENLQEMIADGTLLVDTSGAVIGQVNGLGVYSYADYRFALPSRITATVGVGRDGVVDVEREANLGGRIHSKGVLILVGFLMDRFAQNQPLALAARLTFEQSYGEVDGDSASSTELYALLSRLADAPIKQGLAVTGSVNQRGEVQAIGGVNEKIEGFFATCRARGLTGEQGVLIPAANVRNLMLSEEVVAAVRDRQFKIYPITTIDEGIEILTGVSAGRPDENGHFPDETINGRVESRLATMGTAFRVTPGSTNGHDRAGSQPAIANPRPVPPHPTRARTGDPKID